LACLMNRPSLRLPRSFCDNKDCVPLCPSVCLCKYKSQWIRNLGRRGRRSLRLGAAPLPILRRTRSPGPPHSLPWATLPHHCQHTASQLLPSSLTSVTKLLTLLGRHTPSQLAETANTHMTFELGCCDVLLSRRVGMVLGGGALFY
jgi:hypothetical protein